MEFHAWVAFLMASIFITLSPGSGAVLSMSHGLAYGVRQTTATIFGLQLGLILILLIAGGGVGAVLIASELAFTVVKVLGACYLIYLGWCQWRSAGNALDVAHLQGQAHLPWQRRVLMGFLTNATNPKTTLFVVSLFTQVVSPRTPLPVQLGYGAFMSLAHLAWFVLVALAFSSVPAQRVVASARHHVERGIGGVLVCLGLTLALASLRQA